MLLGKHGSDLFGDDNRKGVFKVIRVVNALLLLALLITLTSKNN